MRYTTISFFTEKYNFVQVLKDLFNTDDLSLLTEHHSELFKVGNDSKTTFHEIFYNKYRSGWPEMVNLYDRFIEDTIAPLYNEDFLYQSFPTARFHIPDNVAVGAFHNDAEFGHPAGEVNYIIPLTNSTDTASVWIESEPGKKDFESVPMQIGRLIQFNGNELTHGNKVNIEGKTRVSMDFRILPLSKYDENNISQSITLKTKFKEGQYYSKFIKIFRW